MIDVQGLSIVQGDFVLQDVSFVVRAGSYGVLMGRSGCGKSSILETVCGLRTPRAGRILLFGRDVTTLAPGERGVGYVPQDRALFPTLAVRDQIAFSLVVRKRPESEIAARVDELAELLGIAHLLDRMPANLSGGEAQRVTLARAVASRPGLLCLDEPLNALDEQTHDEICGLLKEVQEYTGVTVLHVTHSSTEARQLGHQIFHIDAGKLHEIELGDAKRQAGG